MTDKEKEQLLELSEETKGLDDEEYQYLIGYARGCLDSKEKAQRKE